MAKNSKGLQNSAHEVTHNQFHEGGSQTEGISNHFIEKSVSRKIFATLLLRRNWSIIFGNDPTNHSQISFEMRECYVKLRLLVLRFLTKYRTKNVQTFGGLLILLSLF